MSAHPTVALPSNEQLSVAIIAEKQRYIRPPGTPPPRPTPPRRDWLCEALLEASPTRPKRRATDVLVSVVFHTAILAAVVLLPLYATQSLDLKHFTTTLLAPPPPPPPAPPPAATITKPRSAQPKRFLTNGKLLAPRAIPNQVVIVKEATLPADDNLGAIGGVPGGVPGGQLGGVLGGIISEASRTLAPPTAQPRSPLRVGGRIKAPRLLQQLPPVYPVLAKQAKVQGVVSIDAVIDESGNVVEMRVISGPPLLIQAAQQAVAQWRYEPTYLNDKPVAVQLVVTVTFQLWQ
jgi:periplasmic protein TonB